MTIKTISQRIREVHNRIVELELQGASYRRSYSRFPVTAATSQKNRDELQQARQELDYLLQVVKDNLS